MGNTTKIAHKLQVYSSVPVSVTYIYIPSSSPIPPSQNNGGILFQRCVSVRLSVRLSVRPSVRPFVLPSFSQRWLNRFK